MRAGVLPISAATRDQILDATSGGGVESSGADDDRGDGRGGDVSRKSTLPSEHRSLRGSYANEEGGDKLCGGRATR